jgi:hypothetical protein
VDGHSVTDAFVNWVCNAQWIEMIRSRHGSAQPAAHTGWQVWAADGNRHRLVAPFRKDGGILRTAPAGMVQEPKWLCAPKDGSMLVTEEKWGLLHVTEGGKKSWKVVQDMPEGDTWEV